MAESFSFALIWLNQSGNNKTQVYSLHKRLPCDLIG